MNGPLRRRTLGWLALSLAGALLFFARSATAEDLRTISGRVYKDASILRVDSDGIVFSHKFGVVKIPNSELSADTRRVFDVKKARSEEQYRRAEHQRQVAEEQSERQEQVRRQKVNAERAAVEVDEQEQDAAEEASARNQHHRSSSPQQPLSTKRYRLRGEVIGIGTDWVLVACDGGGALSRLRKEIGIMKESTLAVETPAREVLILTGLRPLPAEGSDVDVSVLAGGTRNDVRTRSGEIYAGRYRVFRAVD